MESILLSARNVFTNDIAQKLEGMELGEEDFLAVTRDDIDSEFTECSITQRNELWSFIESQKELLRAQRNEGQSTSRNRWVEPNQSDVQSNRNVQLYARQEALEYDYDAYERNARQGEGLQSISKILIEIDFTSRNQFHVMLGIFSPQPYSNSITDFEQITFLKK